MYIFEIEIFWIHITPSYYWLMYAIWFIIWYYIIKSRLNNKSINKNELKAEFLDDLLMYIVLWVIVWWRIWYIVFYNLNNYINNPIEILKVWEWWMSFHWWVLWVIIVMIIFSKRYKLNFYKLADQISLVVPIWLWLWRVWNYLNWELLWYSWYTWLLSVNWRFPSPLIEMFLEWIILFIILNYIYTKKKVLNPWIIASLFMILYWIFRVFVEAIFRKPDEHIWYIWNYFTLWEIYSLPMIILWTYFYIKLKK